VRCPRCHASIPAVPPARGGAPRRPAFCRECGAPRGLAAEPAPAALDGSLAIDRRVAERRGKDPTFTGLGPTPATREPAPAPRPAALADADRSHWDLGSARATAAGPAPAVTATVDELSTDSDVEVDPLEVHLRRAGSLRRVLAGAIDVLPFLAGGLALARAFVRAAGRGLPAPATGLDGLLDLVAREQVIVLSVAAVVTLALGAYATLAHALAGATLGKRLLGLRVVGRDGVRPSFARSTARSALLVLSVVLLGLGVLLALFTRSGRGLHDLVARTWVVEAP
jgi:uncharacterized RDD family membrane protein YckC